MAASRSVVALAIAGCANWPLHGNLPEDPANLLPVGEDPRGLYELQWVHAEEASDNDSPVGLEHHEVTLDTARHYTGRLDGAGWWDDAEPAVLDGGCGSTWDRSPLGTGDYIGDVDFTIVNVAAAGTLCGRLLLDPPDYGWDLLLHPVDSCDVPSEFVVSGGEPVGLGLGGAVGDWSAPVQPGPYALLVAAYYPNDDAAEVDYELGVALVEAADGAALCPLLPSEGT